MVTVYLLTTAITMSRDTIISCDFQIYVQQFQIYDLTMRVNFRPTSHINALR